MKGCFCIISQCITLFKSFYISIKYPFSWLYSTQMSQWHLRRYGHPATGFNRLCRETTTV